jgi:hypothetical protein
MRRFISWKLVGRLALIVIVLAVVTPIGYGVYARWRGQNALDRVYTQLDATDPGWDIESITRDTNAKLPPDDKNPFVVATTAYGQLPASFTAATSTHPDLGTNSSNTLLDDATKAKVIASLTRTEAATDTAMTLLATPGEGGNVIVQPPNPTDRRLDKEQNLRQVAYLLSLRATLEANAGEHDAALRSTRAGLAVARGLGSDPMLITQLVRIAVGSVAVHQAERVLGLTEPDAGLAEFQTELLTEAEFPRLLVGLRGERASADRTFDFVASGQASGIRAAQSLLGYQGTADRVKCIEILTAYVEAAKLPPAERQAALRAVEFPQEKDRRYVLTNLLLPAVDKVIDASVRSQGELRAAAVAVACERHRRKLGTWPATLEAIDKAILPALPVDPADGKPLRYKRLPDGVVVYTIGPDGVDHGGTMDSNAPRDKRDYGMRLYDVPMRWQPAPPPPDPAERPDEEAP